ncbi:hypothetical protein B9N43_03355 [Denitratisoma sp. DHT3]|nr:hypothetical protein B9N43_03355 [Denitratisoma sp. DHT3]
MFSSDSSGWGKWAYRLTDGRYAGHAVLLLSGEAEDFEDVKATHHRYSMDIAMVPRADHPGARKNRPERFFLKIFLG